MNSIPPDDVIITDWDTARVWLRGLRNVLDYFQKDPGISSQELDEMIEHTWELEDLLGEERCSYLRK